MISSNPPASLPESAPARASVGARLGVLLNRLEEVLIATLIAVATLLVFVAVLHRYGTSSSIDLAKWLEAHGMAFAAPPFRAMFALAAGARPVVGAGAVHLHVHLDGQVRRRLWRAHRHPRGRRRAGDAHGPGAARAR